MTTSTPPRAKAHSSGINATEIPARRSRWAKTFAASTDAHTTNVGPTRAAANRAGIWSALGGKRKTPPPSAKSLVAAGDTGSAKTFVRRSGAGRVTTILGEAVTKNGRSLEAHQRTEAQRHKSIISASGPIPLDLSIDFSLTAETPGDGKPSETTQPPTRRPFKETRTRDPISIDETRSAGTT